MPHRSPSMRTIASHCSEHRLGMARRGRGAGDVWGATDPTDAWRGEDLGTRQLPRLVSLPPKISPGRLPNPRIFWPRSGMPGCLPDVVSDQDFPTRTPGSITPRLRPRTRTHTRPLSRKHSLRKAYVNAKLTDSPRLETEYPPSGERWNASHQTRRRLRLGSPAKGATRTWGTAGDIAQRYQDGMVLHPFSLRYNTSLRLPV